MFQKTIVLIVCALGICSCSNEQKSVKKREKTNTEIVKKNQINFKQLIYVCEDDLFFFTKKTLDRSKLEFMYNSYSSTMTIIPYKKNSYSDGVYYLIIDGNNNATLKTSKYTTLKHCVVKK